MVGKTPMAVAGVALLALVASPAAAEPLKMKILYRLAEQTRYEIPLPDSEKHWVRIAKFTGTVEGGGPFDGAQATEMGFHDVFPGKGGVGAPLYHVLALKGGGTVTLRGDRELIVIPTGTDKPAMVYSGQWRVLGGTGAMAGIQGAGTYRTSPLSPTESRLEFEGHFSPPKP